MSDLSFLNEPIILASASPRRKELLEKAGFSVEVHPLDVDESYPPDLPITEVALYIARKKAEAARVELPQDRVILTADSVVILDNEILGKPRDKEEATEMLRNLSGQNHLVMTGVCLIRGTETVCIDVKTEVLFEELSDEEINYYISYYQPYDKAGAYGIQDWIGWCKVRSIKGSYANVMGLPVHEVYQAVKKGF